jgi:hypothetical protein
MSSDFEDFKRSLNDGSAAFERINKAISMRNGDGEAYRHKVRRRIGKSMYHGELPICVKPWLPCSSQVPMINLLAVGKDRRRTLCAGFICELLDSRQKCASKNISVPNNTFTEAVP